MTLLLACLFCGVFFVSAALTADGERNREDTPPRAALAAVPLAAVTEEVPEPGPAYLLREVDGRLCVFAAGEEAPILITAISTDRLRQTDREALRRGLPAADWEELLGLLEDFGS